MDREKKKRQKTQKETNWIDEEEWFLPAISPTRARKYYYGGVSQKILDSVKEMHETIPEKWVDDPDIMGVEDLAPWRLRYDKDGRCKGGVVPTTLSSFDHPAKMVPSLAARIISVYSKPGDIILDPMSGIGTTLVEAMTRGRNAIGVELEFRWTKVAWQNIHLVKKNSLFLQIGRGMVIQGDARELSKSISEYNALRALFGEEPYYTDLITFSPPYGDLVGRDRLAEPSATIMDDALKKKVQDHLKYSEMDTFDNIGDRGAGLLGSVEETLAKSGPGKALEELGETKGGMEFLKALARKGKKNKGYIDLAVFSPPYADVVKSGSGEGPHTHVFTKWLKNKYGIEDKVEYKNVERYFKEFTQEFSGYSTDESNIGNESVETYWDSMRKVYEECLRVLKPGGHCILVTGDYYRNKKRVPIGEDTIRLMVSIGFEFLRCHRRIYNNRSFFIEAMWKRCDHHRIGRRKEGKHNRRCVHEKNKDHRQTYMMRHIDEAKKGVVDMTKWPSREWCTDGNCPGWINTLEKIDWEDVLVFRKPR
jgi:DNA modification methylase